MRACILLALTAGTLVGADAAPGEAAKKEQAKLQGTWTVASAERDGKPDPALAKAKVVIAGDKFSRTSPGGQKAEGTLKLDPAKKTLDATLTDGPDKGKTLEGTYALEGDTLKICYGAPGKPRPAELTSKPGSGHLLLVLHKEKAPAPVAKQAPAPAKPAAPPAKPVPPPFPDKSLEAAVRAALHLDAKAELNDTTLGNLYILEADNKGIRDLKGLEKCKNLALIKLSKNQITDVTALKGLSNLQSLDLARNQIADVAPLGGLTRLQYLELSNNQVGKADPLAGLMNLSALYLTGNKVTDVGPLGKLTKLASLYLGHNQVKDIGFLATVNNLTTLELNDNQISDLTPLAKQTQLSLVLLERNKITDLTPLVNMAKADAEGAKRFAPYLRLYLAGNPLSDAAKSTQLTALKNYGVRVES
jgi:internalin A